MSADSPFDGQSIHDACNRRIEVLEEERAAAVDAANEYMQGTIAAEHRIEELTAERDELRNGIREIGGRHFDCCNICISGEMYDRIIAAESQVAALSAQVEAYRGLETADDVAWGDTSHNHKIAGYTDKEGE